MKVISRLGQTQSQTQKLKMTTELRQSIQLLQYDIQELNEFLYETSLENPLLKIHENISDIKRKKKSNTEQNIFPEDNTATTLSLYDYLLEQLRDCYISEGEKKIGEYLIFMLDENGYLQQNIATIAELLGKSFDEIEKMLNLIQTFEPVGVGAKDVRECLLIQLKRKENSGLAYLIIDNYFHFFITQNIKQLSKKLNVPFSHIQQAFDEILVLHPKPGVAFSTKKDIYVIPDMIVKREEGEFVVYMNGFATPKIDINEEYSKLLDVERGEVAIYLKEKKQQVDWIQRCLMQRQQTMKVVITEIIKKQQDFFEKGSIYLQPLTMKEVADAVGLHESTISRAVKNKYVQTSFGTWEMKDFFVNNVSQERDEATTIQVHHLIKEIVNNEDKLKPLSDQKIANILKDRYDIPLSRRVITKYRVQLQISSSSRRKKYG